MPARRPLLVLLLLISAGGGTAAAQSRSDRLTVVESAPIYLLPDSNRTPLRTAASGTLLELVTDEGAWLQVRFQDPQFGVRVGYVQEKFVRRPPPAELRAMDLSVREAPSPGVNTPPAPPEQPGQDSGANFRESFPDAGTIEMRALGSVTGVSANGEIATEALLQAFTGVFLNRHVEIGGALTGYKLADFDLFGSVGAAASLNFPNNSVFLPFIGGVAGKGFGYSTLVGNPWHIGVEGGFRIMTPRRGGALIVAPFYQRQFFSAPFVDEDVNVFGLSLGASVLF